MELLLEPLSSCLSASEPPLQVSDRVRSLLRQIASQSRTRGLVVVLDEPVTSASAVAAEHHEIGPQIVSWVLQNVV